MKRRDFLMAGAGAMAVAALPARAAELALDDISAYLNSLGTVSAPFKQFNADGGSSSGKLWIQRPGRMRFEYAPPNEALVMASSGQVAIFDGKGAGAASAQRYPLRQTPLNLILERNINLKRRSMVREMRYDGKFTSVFAQDPSNPQYGYIELRFTDAPIRLAEWVVVDSTGTPTKVILGPFEALSSIPASYFSIGGEEDERK